jgi:hypothetical protein
MKRKELTRDEISVALEDKILLVIARKSGLSIHTVTKAKNPNAAMMSTSVSKLSDYLIHSGVGSKT